MKIAVIDMGTNTFHLLLAEVDGAKYSVFKRFREVVKIGERGLKDRWITLEAQTRSLETLIRFREHIDNYGAERIFATATSAMRNADNGLDLVQMIKETTNIDVRIISGQEEATLIYGGVKRAVNLKSGSFLIMDIGGGSIEFIIVRDGEALWMESFEIGGQRLIDDFHKNDPITFAEIENLEHYFEKSLTDLHQACSVFQPKTLVGASGTFDTLSEMYCHVNNINRSPDETELPLDLDHYHEIHGQLITKNRKERLAIPGMIEMRVDMIVAASVLITYILRRYDLTDLTGSSYALKEGVLFDILDNLRNSEDIRID